MTTSTSSGISTSTRSRFSWTAASALYVFLAGVWLAVLQVGFFLSLQLLLSSAMLTYVVIVLSWLVGAGVGVWIPRGPWVWGIMLGSGMGPYVSMKLLTAAPYDTSLVWVHAGLVFVTALFAGQLFQQERESFRRIGDLFFWENPGFILGLILGVLGFVLGGRGFLYAAPLSGLVGLIVVGGLRAGIALVGRKSS